VFCQACDVVNALSETYREHFLAFFPIIQSMIPYIEPTSRDGYRMHLSGTLAEIVYNTKQGLTQHNAVRFAFPFPLNTKKKHTCFPSGRCSIPT